MVLRSESVVEALNLRAFTSTSVLQSRGALVESQAAALGTLGRHLGAFGSRSMNGGGPLVACRKVVLPRKVQA